MTNQNKKSSDLHARTAAGVLLIVGAGVSMWFAVYGFPSLGFPIKSEVEEQKPETQIVSETIDLSFLDLEIADTEPARQLGLGGRDSLGENEGMLFVFPTYGQHGFWMKGMRIPIDIIWIDGETVVDVVTLSPPYPTLPIPPSHTPKAEADLVLELAAGRAAELGIKEGVKVTF